MSKQNQPPTTNDQQPEVSKQEVRSTEQAAESQTDVSIEQPVMEEEKSEWQVKAEEYLNDLKRVQADFENYKKRQAAEAKEFSSHLAKSIVSDLIPVLDNLHAAAEHVPTDLVESPWVKGITYIEKQFEDALKNYGVVPIEVKPGDAFNPLEHEAVTVTNDQQPTTNNEGVNEAGNQSSVDSRQSIVKILQKGYKVGDRVIKAARVTVR